MLLRSGFLLIAQRLQEAADMAHSNVRNMLRDAVNDAHKGTGKWASYVDHTGDGETGDCIYNCDGDMKSAPYEIATLNGKHDAKLDTSKAKKVSSVISYPEQADDDDHYTAMEESFKAAKLYEGGLPLYERFISKSERNSADEADFAGKGKSFPILKAGDVQAAVHAMGRAGSENKSTSALKASIIAIAKRKGWTSELPKAWQGSEADRSGYSREGNRGSGSTRAAQNSDSSRSVPYSGASSASERTLESGTANRETLENSIMLVESEDCGFLQSIPVQEARANYPIKLISPGTGSMAHYPADVLERDGPKLFKKGTLMFWNHPTAQESAQRPEGNLDNLAAITTKDAEYKHDGPKGPGLYAEAKVMADYAQKVEERAPHIGLSIRAGGTGDGTKVNGKPVLKSIDYVESVDYVTKAGRGGLALAEAARDAGILPNEGVTDMTLQEAQALVAKEVKAALAPYAANDLREAAKKEGKAILESVSWPKSAKKRLIKECMAHIPVKEDGSLDAEKFRALVVAESKEFGAVLAEAAGSGRVIGMGDASPFVTPLTEAQREEQRLAEKRQRKEGERLREGAVDIFSRLTGGNREAAEAAAKGRAA